MKLKWSLLQPLGKYNHFVFLRGDKYPHCASANNPLIKKNSAFIIYKN